MFPHTCVEHEQLAVQLPAVVQRQVAANGRIVAFLWNSATFYLNRFVSFVPLQSSVLPVNEYKCHAWTFLPRPRRSPQSWSKSRAVCRARANPTAFFFRLQTIVVFVWTHHTLPVRRRLLRSVATIPANHVVSCGVTSQSRSDWPFPLRCGIENRQGSLTKHRKT